eukprot:3197374-Rhodomonas_salina.2
MSVPRVAKDPSGIPYTYTGHGIADPCVVPDMAYSPKSNTRNRIPGTKCTASAVSCIGFRGAVDQYLESKEGQSELCIRTSSPKRFSPSSAKTMARNTMSEARSGSSIP